MLLYNKNFAKHPKGTDHPLFGLFSGLYPGHETVSQNLACEIEAQRGDEWDTSQVKDWILLCLQRAEQEATQATQDILAKKLLASRQTLIAQVTNSKTKASRRDAQCQLDLIEVILKHLQPKMLRKPKAS